MKLLLVFVNDYIYWWSWPMIVWKHLIGYNYSSWSLKYMLFGSYLLKSIFFAWPCMYICIQHVLELLMCSACIYKSLLRAMHVHMVEMQHRHGWDVFFFFFSSRKHAFLFLYNNTQIEFSRKVEFEIFHKWNGQCAHSQIERLVTNSICYILICQPTVFIGSRLAIAVGLRTSDSKLSSHHSCRPHFGLCHIKKRNSLTQWWLATSATLDKWAASCL